jgi:hypothetical protein
MFEIICIQDSRIKSLEQELELFEWEFVRMKDSSFNTSSKCTDGNTVRDINDKDCSSQSLSHLSTRKCVTDAEKEVRSQLRLFNSDQTISVISILSPTIKYHYLFSPK